MISRRDEEGFSSCLACPCHRAVASTPPRQRCRIGQISAPHVAFALRLRARPSVSLIFEATFAFTVVTARWLVISPRKTLSIGFKVLVSLHPAIQTTGLLTPAPAGLSPAEHASFRWTHNRTSRFPASGSRTRLHALLSRATPSVVSEHSAEFIGCPISRSFTAYFVCLELRSLPSTGVTRLQRYYEPLRHHHRAQMPWCRLPSSQCITVLTRQRRAGALRKEVWRTQRFFI